MSLRKKIVIGRLLIVFIVLLVPISLTAQTKEQYRDLGIILEKEMVTGEKAPNGGVLVPWAQYYYYNDLVERSFQDEIHPPECESCFKTMIITALSFFVIGYMTNGVVH